MTDPIDAEFRELVANNWGLVFELYTRAQELRRRIGDESRAAVMQREFFKALEPLDVDVYIQGPTWCLRFKIPPHPYIGYVWVEVPTDCEKLTAKVYTSLGGLQGGYADIKRALKAETKAAFDVGFDSSAARATTVTRVIDLDPIRSDAEAMAQAVANEVERQTPLAAELREIVRARLAK
jgi:hypothetical protein